MDWGKLVELYDKYKNNIYNAPNFDQVWSTYPRKIEKAAAQDSCMFSRKTSCPI